MMHQYSEIVKLSAKVGLQFDEYCNNLIWNANILLKIHSSYSDSIRIWRQRSTWLMLNIPIPYLILSFFDEKWNNFLSEFNRNVHYNTHHKYYLPLELEYSTLLWHSYFVCTFVITKHSLWQPWLDLLSKSY